MVDFIGPTYQLLGNSMASRHAVNCYLQSGEGEAKYDKILVGSAGTQLIQDVGSIAGENGCRGIWLASNGPYPDSTLYSVFGSKLVKTIRNPLSGLLESTQVLGIDIGLSSSRVSMTDNGKYLVLVNGTSMWLIDLFTDEVFQPSLPFNTPTQVVYLTGRILCITLDNDTVAPVDLPSAVKNNLIWWSALGLEGPKTWSAAAYASAEASADPILAIGVRQGDVWAFGPQTYQVFSVTASAQRPIAYAGGSASNIGIHSSESLAVLGETVFWLGSNASGKNIVFMASGYNAIRVSNHGIENLLNQYGDLTKKAIGFAYQEEGHLFYCLTIPQGQYTYEGEIVSFKGRTYVFDVTTGQWHERVSRDPVDGSLGAWTPIFSAYAFGKIVVGNILWPVLMELRQDVYVDYDRTYGTRPIYREYQSGVFYENLQNFILDELQWDIVVGHGPLNGQGSNPKASLAISYDGGNTFVASQEVNIYKTGYYGGRVVFFNLGMGRAIVVRIFITENMQFMAGQARFRARLSRNP